MFSAQTHTGSSMSSICSIRILLLFAGMVQVLNICWVFNFAFWFCSNCGIVDIMSSYNFFVGKFERQTKQKLRVWCLLILISLTNEYVQGSAVTSEPAYTHLTCSTCAVNQYLSQTAPYVCINCMDNSKTTDIPDEQIAITDCLCNAGYYEKNDDSSVPPDVNQAYCEPCGLGTYKIDDLSDSACDSCTAVDPNTHTEHTGSDDPSLCLCNAGYTRNGVPEATCVVCEAGKYKNALGNGVCSDCPANANSPAGSKSFDDCFCIAGYTHDTDLTSLGDTCTVCAAGKYRDANMLANTATAADYQYLCEDCPVDRYNENTGATALSDCLYCSGDAASRSHTTHGVTGASRADACVCNTGFAGTASTVSTDRQTCAQCGVGTYADGVAQVSCTECSEGKASNAVEALTEDTCVDCTAGYFQATTGKEQCNACPVNEYQPDTGQDHCERCPTESGHDSSAAIVVTVCECNAGYTTFDEISGCTACAAGTYKETRHNNACTNCPSFDPANAASSFSTSPIASTLRSDCTCNAGYHSTTCHLTDNPELGITADSDCISFHSAYKLQCEECPVHHFCGPDVNTAGVKGLPKGVAACMPNSQSEAGSDEMDDCFCNAGYYQYYNVQKCEKCRKSADYPNELPKGYYCPDNDDRAIPCGADSIAIGPVGLEDYPSSMEHCLCPAGRWRNCVPDGSGGYVKHIITDGVPSTEECHRYLADGSPDEDYWRSACVECNMGDVCLGEGTVMQHCPHDATSAIGSDEVSDCKCNAGYKPDDFSYWNVDESTYPIPVP